jgi:hypothetical protein
MSARNFVGRSFCCRHWAAPLPVLCDHGRGAAYGIPRQSSEVLRMRSRIRIYRRRTDVFRGQGFQERAEAVQGVQSKSRAGRRNGLWKRSTGRDKDSLLAVWERDDRPFQADSRPSRILPRMLSTQAGGGCSERDGVMGLKAARPRLYRRDRRALQPRYGMRARVFGNSRRLLKLRTIS